MPFTAQTSAAANFKRYHQPRGNKSLVAKQRPTMPGEYLTLSSLDGRTKASKFAYELFDQFAKQYGLRSPDFGGQKDKLEQAAYLGVRMADMIARGLRGEPVDDALFSLMTNSQRRILKSL
jgi:hypothetical protein